jgi:hypothetical protein
VPQVHKESGPRPYIHSNKFEPHPLIEMQSDNALPREFEDMESTTTEYGMGSTPSSSSKKSRVVTSRKQSSNSPVNVERTTDRRRTRRKKQVCWPRRHSLVLSCCRQTDNQWILLTSTTAQYSAASLVPRDRTRILLEPAACLHRTFKQDAPYA